MDIEQLLAEHGDAAIAVSELLYGDSYEISKAVDEAKSEKLQTRLSQASNAIGLAAGAAATPSVYREFKGARRDYKSAPSPKPKFKLKSLRNIPKGSKAALAVAGGNLALQGVNLGGDALTNVVLRRTAKMQDEKIAKSDFGVYCEISKVDTDKRQVFGWASISKKDGQHVKDLQGDIIDTEELEQAAYNYMLKSRKGGHEHQKGDDGPVHVSDIIESLVITEEKKKALGLPDDTPEGWWVGFKVHDDEVWELAKSGELAGFSLHGTGRRIPVHSSDDLR